MAKKVRRKLEEEEEAAFEFPPFDEVAFVAKEYELTYGLAFASAITVLMGILSWVLSVSGFFWYIVFPLGVLLLLASPYIIGMFHAKSSIYTKGDWAGLLALEFFGWLALWFVLQSLSPHAV
ncbi:MAG TPA: hypothetical protein VEG66_03750 [Thermoplasmata archaeon]|jgi:hypothetical protein|nr:hypothetical protein [Thermoplasmata archaeon]